ncbi:hypothetical protein ABPG75_013216 [Micractinium tetrahymenae]
MQGDINVNAEAQRVLAAGPDRWAQLGVARGADLAEVKRRYKRLCALHPDKNLGNALAAEAFAIVSAAHAELSALLAPAGAPAGAAGPLHATQPDAQQQGNRWQAFTGRQQPRQQQAAPQQAAAPPAQHPRPGGGSSQENRTPEGDCGGCGQQQAPAAAGAGSGWQASRWGKQAGTALFRAQPVAAAAPGACPASGPDGSTHKQQQEALSGERRGSRRGSVSCTSLSFDSGSEGSETGSRPPAAGVRPDAFYGSGARRESPQVHADVGAAAASQPPAASLYGLFNGRRSSGGQPGGWPGSQHQPGAAEQPKWPPPQRKPEQQQPVEQPAQPQQQQDQLAWVQQQQQQRHARQPSWLQAPAHESQPLGSGQQEQAHPPGCPSWKQPALQAGVQQGSHPGPAAATGWASQAGSRWDNNRGKLELLKRPAVVAVPTAGGFGSGQSADADQQAQQQPKHDRASGQAKRRQTALSSGSCESSSNSSSEGESDSDEGFASEPEPDPASLARQQLMQAVLQQQAAERRAAQAEGAAIARAGRDKALQKYRRKRRKKGASSGTGSGKAAAASGRRSTGSGKGSGKGSGTASGSGGAKQQTQLKLVLVRVPVA